MIKIWNFRKQETEKPEKVPGCNGISGGDFEPIYISYGTTGEIKIITSKDEGKK